MPSCHFRQPAFQRADQVFNAVGRPGCARLGELKELRNCHTHYFRRLSPHARCPLTKRLRKLTRESDRDLIFHDCSVMQCITLHNSAAMRIKESRDNAILSRCRSPGRLTSAVPVEASHSLCISRESSRPMQRRRLIYRTVFRPAPRRETHG